MAAETKEKLVKIHVPRGRSNEEPCLMIGINGRNWLLPKGQVSMVPQYVAEEYQRHLEAVDSYSAQINNIQAVEQETNAAARAKIGG